MEIHENNCANGKSKKYEIEENLKLVDDANTTNNCIDLSISPERKCEEEDVQEMLNGEKSEANNRPMKRTYSQRKTEELNIIKKYHIDNKESLTFSNLETENYISNDPKLVNIRVDNLILEHEIDELKNRLSLDSYLLNYQSERLTLEKLENCVELLIEYTGIRSIALFQFILDSICDNNALVYKKLYSINGNAPVIRHEEQLLVTLMRLKCNFGFTDLSFRFKFSTSVIKTSILQWIKYLHVFLFEQQIKNKALPFYADNPSQLPEGFAIFSNCRVIIGAINIEAEVSHRNIGKEYKKKQLRGLIGVSSFNEIIFVSDLYPENVSLQEIVRQSCLFEKLSPGDLILSNEPLNIDHHMPPHVEFNKPLFLDSKHNLSSSKVISKLIVACKGVTDVLKKFQKFAVLDRILLSNRNIASVFFQVCSGLINLETCKLENNAEDNLHGFVVGDIKLEDTCM